jgi:hypothetical protein
MHEVIARRDFRAVSASGESFSLSVCVGRPYLLTDTQHETWRCPVSVDPVYPNLPDIFGSDSWQALWLAVSLVHSQLADFLRRGGHLYYPDSEEEFTLAHFPDIYAANT